MKLGDNINALNKENYGTGGYGANTGIIRHHKDGAEGSPFHVVVRPGRIKQASVCRPSSKRPIMSVNGNGFGM